MPVSLFSNRSLAALALSLGVAACSDQSSIDRPGTWRPTGVNDQNLRAMLADPRDLSGGATATTARGNGAARAATRLYTDRRRPLLDVQTSTVGASTSGSNSEGPALPTSGSGAGQ